MKKNFIYATLSAIALVGAVSLSACSTSEDAEDVNPTFDGQAVKTQFTISLPFNNATTRQTSSIVQEGANTEITKFRGMDGIVLIPFQSATDRTTRLGTNITLNKMVVPSSTDVTNSIPEGAALLSGTGNSNAVLYNDVTIPVGTAGFLFYAEAKASAGGNKSTDGSLTGPDFVNNQTIETSDISFTPTPVLGWKEDVSPLTPKDPTMTIGNAVAAYVSSIAAASSDNGTPDNTTDDIEYIWAKCANSSNENESWYNAGLGEMYTAFTGMKAGASSYVQAAVQDLYTSILNNTDKVSTAIKKAITNTTYVSNTTDGKLTFTDAITGYPADNGMPEGSAALKWDPKTPTNPSENEPKVATALAASNFGHSVESPATAMNVVDMRNIVYPASLYYYASSPIRVSSTSRESDYVASNTWETILNSYSTTNGTVSSATRSVAITKQIEYAVGRLDVKVSALSKTKYYDRKGKVVSPTYLTDPNDANTATPAFQLTGVLIGGQKAVGYEFTPTGTTEYTIYDKKINDENSVSGIVPTAASTYAGPTYTLALETAENTKIYVALEFLNKGADFQGYDGVVKHNCKFYMIAQLDPTTGSANAKSETVNKTGNRVFKQDYKTDATFTIGEGAPDDNGDGVADSGSFGGFANAYTTIPDLRTPQLELGLSVNLEWKPGIEFEVTF